MVISRRSVDFLAGSVSKEVSDLENGAVSYHSGQGSIPIYIGIGCLDIPRLLD
ncbi:hypothetical protein SAMN05216197_11594 [Pseudomonas graminis]|uniref:Uncharacterized protein n=1 Tax=Pseudomonas graminis TaxID=158627 RepID=A0A1I0F3M1_9PSED|nr:hypothetical protein SAMN05216197_11594 [Pseudomonas graminis]